MLKRTVICLLMALVVTTLSAQTKKEATALYASQNYNEALKMYLHLLGTDPDNYEYNFRTGVCYLKTSVVKSKAIPYLTKASSYTNQDPIAYYLLAKAYQYSYQFDAAIRAFEKFINLSSSVEENVRYAKKKIEHCYNAKEFMKFPRNVDFENLGENINSVYPDYFPFVSANESFIVFNSKRDDGSNKLKDGTFSSNIYFSKVENGQFQKAEKLPDVGSDSLNEQIIGLSADGNKLLIAVEGDGNTQVFLADFTTHVAKDIQKLSIDLSQAVNGEVTASINADGDLLYLAMELKGGLGGTDIYESRLLPNGEWSALRNLGSEINTIWDERFPNITQDEKTLFFSSEGHTGLGGMDIYQASRNLKERKWENVKNMAYPLNTPEDELNFRMSSSGKYGYLSVNREDGYGDLDVYRVQFHEADPRFSIITGKLYSVNTTQLKEDVFISVVDLSRNRVYGEYLPNSRTGRYVMALPPGKYKLLVEVEGFKRIDQTIEVFDKSSYQPYIYQDMVLKPSNILMPLPGISSEE
jgi:hypothetical protein